MAARRRRGDRGAVVVEFAIVAPLLFLMMFLLAEFALAELSDTAGANAAREGARVGILYYDGAHVSGSPNNTKISDAVNAKLAGNVKGMPTVAVRCLNPDGSARPSGGSCSTVSGDVVDVGEDLIEVSVTWTRKGNFTPFIHSSTQTDKAVMRIVGAPPTGVSPPSACALTAGSASPSAAVRSGTALPAITFSVTVNDPSLCGAPLIDLTSESGYASAQTMNPTATPTIFDFTMPAGQGSWTTGTKTVTASANGGSVTRTITFVVNDPAVCLVTSATANPSSVTQSGGTLSSAVVFSVTVSDTSTCGVPTLTFPAQAGYPSPRTMSSSGVNGFTFTLPIGQGSWTSATHNITVNVSGTSPGSIALIVADAPVCTLTNLTVSPNPADVKSNGQMDDDVTIRVTRSSLTVCAVPTITVTPGPSGSSSEDLTTAKTMHNIGTTASCTNLTCEWFISKSTGGWGESPSARTVTVTASGSTLTSPFNVT